MRSITSSCGQWERVGRHAWHTALSEWGGGGELAVLYWILGCGMRNEGGGEGGGEGERGEGGGEGERGEGGEVLTVIPWHSERLRSWRLWH